MSTIQIPPSIQGLYSAEQGQGTQTPSPSPAPHPLLANLTERRNHPAEPEFSPLSTSGSFRIGNKHCVQAHLALESNFNFRLISGLENAACFGPCRSKVVMSYLGKVEMSY
jgi:hypothetical protein